MYAFVQRKFDTGAYCPRRLYANDIIESCSEIVGLMPILSGRKRSPSGPRGSAGMVRVIVKLRPEQYDELFHYVRLVGSTLSEFLRESGMNAMDPGREAKSSAQVPAETKTVSTRDQEQSWRSAWPRGC